MAGAAIGALVAPLPGAPVIAFGLGWMSHYALDKVPHWENWFGVHIHGYPGGSQIHELPASAIISGVFDLVVSISLFVLIYRSVGHGPFYLSPIFWGALGGFFPDLLDNVPPLNKLTIYIPGVATERKFHSFNHISDQARRRVPYATGLLTQLVTISISIWFLLNF